MAACPKCTGLLVSGSFQPDDVLYRTEMWLCVNCGYREDAVILANKSIPIWKLKATRASNGARSLKAPMPI